MIAEVLDFGSERVGSSKPFEISVKSGIIQYPKSIDDIDPTTGKHVHSSSLIFSITKAMPTGSNLTGRSLQNRQKAFLQSPATMETIGRFQTYVPAMNEEYKHDYASSDTSVFNDLMGAIYAGMNAGGSIQDKALTGVGKFSGSVIDRGVQAEMSNKSVVMETGRITRQRQSYLYNGTAMRTHTFNFVMRPRNRIELMNVGQIIHMFRKFSSGSRTTFNAVEEVGFEKVGVDIDSFGVVAAPPVWFVEEVISDKSLPRSIDKFVFGPAAVTGVRVNKTPDQIYQTIANTSGDPVEVELEVTMQELIPVYSDYWDDIRTRGMV